MKRTRTTVSPCPPVGLPRRLSDAPVQPMNTPEHSMLSPSGTKVKDMQSMANLVFRR